MVREPPLELGLRSWPKRVSACIISIVFIIYEYPNHRLVAELLQNGAKTKAWLVSFAQAISAREN